MSSHPLPPKIAHLFFTETLLPRIRVALGQWISIGTFIRVWNVDEFIHPLSAYSCFCGIDAARALILSPTVRSHAPLKPVSPFVALHVAVKAFLSKNSCFPLKPRPLACLFKPRIILTPVFADMCICCRSCGRDKDDEKLI